MFDISPIQILIVLVIALLVFGPKRLPEMGKSIGRGIREFKGAMLDDDEPRRAPAPRAEEPARASTAPPPAPAAPAATMSRPDDDDVLDGVVVPGDAPPRGDDRAGS